jgi:hypothetical protein
VAPAAAINPSEKEMTMDEKNFDAMTARAAMRAQSACVKRLKKLHWTEADMKKHRDNLATRLRDACVKHAKHAMAAFLAAKKAGEYDEACEAIFFVPFVTAGVEAAIEFDKAQVDAVWQTLTAE